MLAIDFAIQCRSAALDRRRARTAIRRIGKTAQIDKGHVSVAIVDDPTIARLNEQFLGHRGATDVLSFVLEHGPGWLEGQIIASADTAVRQSSVYGWSAEEELLLYVVHGALHLVGYEDARKPQRAAMRQREREVFAELGIEYHAE